ncbi:formimidoyltetrahydrofolate cyclodeaminase [Rhodococcus sp. ACS1]|jgi:formiminotetrahydrofolate cyclodeaminase|uniref:Formiminotetrahydrofolate cyclodeaminase n=1 Tax=Rhodococcus koreensis TaxID=99653 RepID=A0A1H4WN12_9NOCA|nr:MULTISPECIES: cyclodeaminase/cyclohydrolase family protein [Rhodococcus]PBC47718.1 formimidoyltetrahydrofolate cyclodeaminase [Rhodococcus sp. ACS1]QSE80683.1 cyclodeaminase/cyclohydrolase family protein [Rhodococcus koreensis]SEC94696.1 Formiminotetrahydrofolate cyclodeaminase [Rhodococcus koreensis]
MQQETISSFLDSLAARVPAPGGGATAALHVGQAAALVAMVARYTTGDRYAEHSALVERVCTSADALRGKALQFAEDDMAAFTSVIDAYKLPKGTDEENAARSAAIEGALVNAARVPVEVIDAAAAVVTLAEELGPVANRNVVSDVAAATEAARAAATTARVNVEINLPGITDPAIRQSLIDSAAGVDALADRADAVTAQVRKQLNS